MEEYILLSDGTKVENAYVVKLSDNRIAIYVTGAGFRDMVAWFCDAALTEHMESYQYGDIREWNGFVLPDALEVLHDSAYICLERSVEA